MDPNVIRDPREKLSMKRPIDFIIRQGSAWLDGPEAGQIDEEVWSWANESKRSNVLLSDMRGSIWINDQSEQLDASDKTYLKMMRNEHALILCFDLLL